MFHLLFNSAILRISQDERRIKVSFLKTRRCRVREEMKRADLVSNELIRIKFPR